MRKPRGRIWKTVRRLLLAGIAALLLLLMPVAYVELGCRGEARADSYRPLIVDPAFQRREANTYLTYPEWHIVYAYDGLAEALKTGDEHRFDYWSSIAAFWRSTCALMRTADEHGGADFDTRSMIHTIGVSFTMEMLAKAAYEETAGRAVAWLRGGTKTPQDQAIAKASLDYAAFLRQNPWYVFPFDREVGNLWAAPVTGVVRGWERRLAIGFELTLKRAYAGVIGGAVAATAPAQLVIRTVVSGLDTAALAKMPDVKVVGPVEGGVVIETPRYDLFTRILVDVAKRNGTVREIAGNDDIMVTLTVPAGSELLASNADVILRMRRESFATERLLVNVKVTDLAALLRAYPLGDPGLEHVFDY